MTESLGVSEVRALRGRAHHLDPDLLPAVRDAAAELLANQPQAVSPLLARWLRHGQQYGQV